MTTVKQTEPTARDEPGGGTAMHWIGGQWLDSGEKHGESVNAATGTVIGRYAKGGRTEAEPPRAFTREVSGSRGRGKRVVTIAPGT